MSSYGMNHSEIEHAVMAGMIVGQDGWIICCGKAPLVNPGPAKPVTLVSAGSPSGKTFKTGRDPDDGDDLAPIRQPAPKCYDQD